MAGYGDRRHAILGTEYWRQALVVAPVEFVEKYEERGRQVWEARTVGDIRRIEGLDLDSWGYFRWCRYLDVEDLTEVMGIDDEDALLPDDFPLWPGWNDPPDPDGCLAFEISPPWEDGGYSGWMPDSVQALFVEEELTSPMQETQFIHPVASAEEIRRAFEAEGWTVEEDDGRLQAAIAVLAWSAPEDREPLPPELVPFFPSVE